MEKASCDITRSDSASQTCDAPGSVSSLRLPADSGLARVVATIYKVEARRSVDATRIQIGAGRRLAKLGERLGWSWLIYNPGICKNYEQIASRNARPLADAVLSEYPSAKSLVDIGCGAGVIAAEFQSRGLRVHGCEYSRTARRRAARRSVAVSPFDLSRSSEPPVHLRGQSFDLALTTEVAEHIPAGFANAFVEYIASLRAHDVVFTAAQPGQGGEGHINEQPKSYWIEKFARCGFVVDAGRGSRMAASLRASDASPFLYNNVIAFHRAQ